MNINKASYSELKAAEKLAERYAIQRLISQNPGRKTFLAQDQATGSPVILKLLSFSQDFDWQDLKLFQREAEILQELDHLALPQYLDSFDFETPRTKGIGLVQSYIEARSLQEHLSAGRSFSEAELQDIATQLLDILTYAHGLGIIHRDLKPSNILLGNPEPQGKHGKKHTSPHSLGQVYLVDFGSVQTLAARIGQTQTIVGTYGYMPPEQFGSKTIPVSDLYALGATLIFLGTGKHPAELAQDGLRIQCEPLVDHWSPALIQWVQQLIAPSLEQRFRTAKAAKSALQRSVMERAIRVALQPDLPLPAPPPGAAVRLQRWDDGRDNGIRPVMLRNRLTLGLAQQPASDPLMYCLRWLALIRDDGAFVVTIFFAPASALLSLILLVGLFVQTPVSIGYSTMVVGFSAALLGGFIGYAIWRVLKTLRRYGRRHQTATIDIGPNTITIRYRNEVLQRLQRHQVWQLVSCDRSLSRSFELRLSIGQYTLRYAATSQQERDWLGQVLSDVLELPLEN